KGGADSLRELVVKALRNAGPDGERALVEAGLPVLLKDLEKEEPAVQDHTLRVLAQMGPLAAKALPALERMARAGNSRSREQAFETLSQIGPGGLSVLLDVARQGDVRKKQQVLDVFRWRAKAPETVVPALIGFLDDADAGVRYRAAIILRS